MENLGLWISCEKTIWEFVPGSKEISSDKWENKIWAFLQGKDTDYFPEFNITLSKHCSDEWGMHCSNLCPFISNSLLSTFDRNKDWCSKRMLVVAPTNIQSLLPKIDTWEPEDEE